MPNNEKILSKHSFFLSPFSVSQMYIETILLMLKHTINSFGEKKYFSE